MKFANRVKFTVAITSAGTITPPTAANVTGYRTLAQAIAAGDLAGSDTGIPFVIEDAAGNWEESYFTISADGLTMTRTAVAASSAGGTTAATFTGTPAVFCTPFAAYLASLLSTTDGVTLAQLASTAAITTVPDSYVSEWCNPADGKSYVITYANLKAQLAAAIGGTAPAEAITVATPAAQTAGIAFTVSGTYANGSPTALDWSINGGSSWTAAATPTISGGAYSFGGVSVPSANASQTVMVRDHNAQTVTGTSASFVVNAAASPAAPGAPTIGTATAGDTTASFPFAAPSSNGGAAIDTYQLTVYNASTNAVVGTFTGTTSPISATGLTDGTGYYGKIAAHNSAGYGAQSAASNSVTPVAAASATVYTITRAFGDHQISSETGLPISVSIAGGTYAGDGATPGSTGQFIAVNPNSGISDQYIYVSPAPASVKMGWGPSATVPPSGASAMSDEGALVAPSSGSGTGPFQMGNYMWIRAVQGTYNRFPWIELDNQPPVCLLPANSPCVVTVSA